MGPQVTAGLHSRHPDSELFAFLSPEFHFMKAFSELAGF